MQTSEELANWCHSMAKQMERFFGSGAEHAGYPAQTIARVYEDMRDTIRTDGFAAVLTKLTSEADRFGKPDSRQCFSDDPSEAD